MAPLPPVRMPGKWTGDMSSAAVTGGSTLVDAAAIDVQRALSRSPARQRGLQRKGFPEDILCNPIISG